MSAPLVRDEYSVEEMCAARDETRARIATLAVTLIEAVLARSNDLVARETASSMAALIAQEHSLVAAIRAEVG